MWTHFDTRTRFGIGAFALAIGVFGCVKSGPRSHSSAAVSVAGSVSPASSRSMLVFESRTVSFALDRIDQRELPLDRTFRRAGTGKGVTVYVFDGGISDTHPELAGRVRRGYSAFPDDPAICNAHGTAVAGAVAGSTLGVAPEVEIVDVKMVQCRRLRGTIRGIVDGAKWVVEEVRRNPGRPAIANWSFIADTASNIPALDSAVAMLVEAGVPVVVSAGNLETDACRVSPANSGKAIVVGASTVERDVERNVTYDRRAPGTAYGSCIDVYAPGDSVLLPSLDRELNAATQVWRGTSMSAGYVSGAIALFLEANPRATPDDVGNWIRETATPNAVRGSRSTSAHLLYVGTSAREERAVAARD
jgi:subtilisin family serine protease